MDKSANISSLFKQYYRKLAQIRSQRLDLLKNIEQESKAKEIKNLKDKIKNL